MLRGRRVGTLAGLLEGHGKVAHRGKARFGVFGQGAQHDLLDLERNGRHVLVQRGRGHAQLLGHHLAHRALKGTLATQPFVHHAPQRILVAGRARVSLDLLGSHIGQRARRALFGT